VVLPPVFLSGFLCIVLACRPPRLIFVSFAVAACDGVEAAAALGHLVYIGWTKTAVAGLVCKYSMLSMLLVLCESGFRLRGPEPTGCRKLLVSRLELWLHAHRMLRDVIVSALILVGLAPGVLLGLVSSRCFNCRCSLHNMLVYRDPGHPSHIADEIDAAERQRTEDTLASSTQEGGSLQRGMNAQLAQVEVEQGRSAGQAVNSEQQVVRQPEAMGDDEATVTPVGVRAMALAATLGGST